MINSQHSGKINISKEYNFGFNPGILDDNFPKSINLNEIESFTIESFKDNYFHAREAGLPYYLISIAEIAAKKQNLYKFYDAQSFHAHKITCINREEELLCPNTRLPVNKIYYLALDCFQPSGSSEEFTNIEAKLVNPLNFVFENQSEDIFFDALNYHILLGDDPEETCKVKECQKIIGFHFIAGKMTVEALIELHQKFLEKKIEPSTQNNKLVKSLFKTKIARLEEQRHNFDLEIQKWWNAYNFSLPTQSSESTDLKERSLKISGPKIKKGNTNQSGKRNRKKTSKDLSSKNSKTNLL